MAGSTAYVRNLVAVTTREFDDFHELDEHDEPLRSRIDLYCDAAGVPRPANIDDFPWSAVFISWCVKTAGATSQEFVFSDTHAVFVRAAIANADAKTGVFRARPIDVYKPKVGDLIHRNREGGKITYAQARSRSDYPSHSAIVVDIVESGNSKFALTIGGNESNSIRQQRVRLTSAGFVKQTASNPYIAVVEDLKSDVVADGPSLELAVYPAGTPLLEPLVCDAGGSGETFAPESAPAKPPAQQHTTNHRDSRGGAAIDHIVMHYTTSRNINGSISHFKTGTPRTSAHYIVGQDGALVQIVPDADNAWHAGNSQMNKRSIGIEHVAMLGDKITPLQSATSIALIRYLMHTYGIPSSNIIPHVCVKSTSCCGDLFADFGGGAGLSCTRQLGAVRGWLTANGVSGHFEAIATGGVGEQMGVSNVVLEAATPAQALKMAKAIVAFEARRDAQGRIAIYQLPPGDGGGRYEVAGINERYHKAVCDELVALIQGGRHAEAELRAAEFMAEYTNKAGTWTSNPGIEFYLRDSMFNRGPGGAAWILQKAVGVTIDQSVGPQTLAAVRAAEARPRELLDKLRTAREAYERLRRDESSPFWAGLVNRWNKARQIALTFMPASQDGTAPVVEAALELQAAQGTGIDANLDRQIPFIDHAPAGSPSFHDIGGQSPIDDPVQMLEGIRSFRNHPDISLEINIGRDTSLPASFLEVLATQRRAVGKISTTGRNYAGSDGAWSGTGFLVARNILLTNHHVLNSTEVAERATIDFTYEVAPADIASGIAEPKAPSVRRYRFDPDKLFITSPVANGGLDYTFVWIEDEAERSFGSITMARSAFSVSEGERAFIVHHPEGRGRRVSLDENDVLRITTSVVRYSADTLGGSSGSPVFNRQGRLIALHHASAPDTVTLPGGGETKTLNEGIKIAAIVADLETRNSGPESAFARRVLEVVQGSDTMAGFFGSLGRTRQIAADAPSVERVVDVYKGSDEDIDIGFWNIEWLSNRYRDPEKLRLAAFLIVDLGLDIWGLEEVSPPAVRALVKELEDRFGEKYGYDLSEPDAGENKQSTAVIWKTKTVTGRREEWPDEIERQWHLRSTDDLGLEAVEGKIFDRYPGLFHFTVKSDGGPFEFYVVPLHLKAMDEGSKRRKLASRLLARAVKTMIEDYHKDGDWVLGGDFNAELASNDFADLLKGDFVPLSAADENAGEMSYIKSPKSLIDHIFLSPNLVKRTGDDSYFIVAKEKSVDSYADKLSDHRPVLVRLRLAKVKGHVQVDNQNIDAEIARLLQTSPPKPTRKGKSGSNDRSH